MISGPCQLMVSYQNLDGSCCGKMGGEICLIDSSFQNSLTGVVVAVSSQNQHQLSSNVLSCICTDSFF